MERPIREKGRGQVPLEITQRQMAEIYLLTLKGRLVLGQESNGFRTTIDDLLSSGATKIVVNLEQVNYVDSAGLGALIEMHRKTKAKGGRLMLSNLGPNLKHALQVARLLTIFETCATEAAAVASF
jgi:anti-sigma B factor antagonist